MSISAEPDTRLPTEAVARSLAALDRVEARIEAFVDVYREGAQTRARQIEQWNLTGPLAGVPVAVKDLYDVAGRPTLSGSKAASTEPVAEDSAAVRRLREAGAIIIGKTVTHEYAFGAMSPPTKNPWDLTRVPAGSSGGSGAAVAAGVVPIAMGTDTGGSIRMPAAVCGTVGFKPTYGLISRAGISPLSHTLDHAGPLTSRVSEAALVVDALAGYDPSDPGSRELPAPHAAAALTRGVEGLKLGIAEKFFFEEADPDIAEACRTAARELEAAGAELVPVDFPDAAECGEATLVIAAAEAAFVHRERIASRRDDFAEDVAAAIDMGLGFSAVDLVEAYAFRTALLEKTRKLFAEVDAVLTPTVGTEPPPLDATTMVLNGREVPTLTGLNAMTVQANLIGAPALAVPAGLNRNGLPVSLQILTAPEQDALALAIGQAYESRTEWHTIWPSLLAE